MVFIRPRRVVLFRAALLLCAREGDFRILFMPKNPSAEKTAEEPEALEAEPVAVSVDQTAEVAA